MHFGDHRRCQVGVGDSTGQDPFQVISGHGSEGETVADPAGPVHLHDVIQEVRTRPPGHTWSRLAWGGETVTSQLRDPAGR